MSESAPLVATSTLADIAAKHGIGAFQKSFATNTNLYIK
jgi:hypothetical protein